MLNSASVKAGFYEILGHNSARIVAGLDKVGCFCSSAKGFDSKSTGSCKKVENPGALNSWPERGEQGLSNSISGWPSKIFWDLKLQASCGSGDDSHGLNERPKIIPRIHGLQSFILCSKPPLRLFFTGEAESFRGKSMSGHSYGMS